MRHPRETRVLHTFFIERTTAMADESIIGKLKSLEAFGDIAPSHLEKLAPLCEVVNFDARTDIFRQYEKAVDVFAIVEGEVSLVLCDASVACRQIGVVKEGQLLGWSPALGRARLTDTARTETPVTALKIDGQKLLEFCQQDTEFGYEFMRRIAITLADRLSGTRRQLFEQSGLNLPEVQIESD